VPFTALPFTALPFTALPFTALPFTGLIHHRQDGRRVERSARR